MAAPVAPGIAIAAIANGQERDTVQVSATFTGGAYDANRTEYRWSVRHSNGNLWQNSDSYFNNPHEAQPTFTRPDVNSDTNIQVRLDCTFYGTGSQSGQTITAFDVEPTRVTNVLPADAPSVQISVPATADGFRPYERTTITIDAPNIGETHAGRFDRLSFRWEAIWYGVDRADDFCHNKYSQQTKFDIPDVADGAIDQLITLRLHVIAYGENGGTPLSPLHGPALRGTQDETVATFRLFIRDRPNANAPAPVEIRHSLLNTDHADPPAVDDDSWVAGMGTGVVGTKMWVQAVFSRAFPEDLPNDPGVLGEDTWDGPLEYAWRLGFERTNTGEPIPEGDNKRVFLYTRKRTDEHTRGDRQNLQVIVTARGNDGNAEAGTVSSKRHVTTTGFTEFPPRLQQPRVGIVFDPPGHNITERSTVNLECTLTGGAYSEGTENYEWILGKGQFPNFQHLTTDDTFTNRYGRTTQFTAPSVDGDEELRIECSTSVGGNPPEYRDEKIFGTANQDITILNHRPADAPSVEVNSVATGRAGTNVRLTAKIGQTYAGRYDRLTYRWSLYKGTSSVDIASSWLSDVTSRDPELTRPGKENNENTDYSLVLAVTAHGEDHLAAEGSTHTIKSAVRHFTIQPLPHATSPDSITINAIPDGEQGETVELGVTIVKGSGVYDAIHTEWRIIRGQNRFVVDDFRNILNPRWTRPDVTQDTVYRVELAYNAVGEGETSAPGTQTSSGDPSTWPVVHTTATVIHHVATRTLTVYVSDAEGTATQLTDIYVTDAEGTATQLTDIYVTDADGVATRI